MPGCGVVGFPGWFTWESSVGNEEVMGFDSVQPPIQSE